jgi:hypothetical protein
VASLEGKVLCARTGFSRSTGRAATMMSDSDSPKAEDDPKSSTTLLGDFL